MDVLDDILSSLRLTGGVVIDCTAHGDWCMLSQFTNEHCAPFFPVPGNLIGYHYVRSGTMIAELDGYPPVEVPAGWLVMLPRNDPHLLYSRPGLEPIDVGDLVEILPSGLQRIVVPGDGPPTEIFCGYLGVSSSHHPLLDSLPPILSLDVHESHESWLESSLRFVAEQEPSADLVARLAEVFFAQAIRTYVAGLPEGRGGWLRGLTDPAVSRALSIIHTRYAEDLDVDTLAREAGVSRSVLGERFGELIGEPPMRYCARWRMRVAANMLRDGGQNTANVAYAVGFNSEAAFNRAFKREYGEPPATWRRREEARAAATPAAPRAADADVIDYCSGSDGTRIAFAVTGEGFPLVKAQSWMAHLEADRGSPAHGHWVWECSRRNRFIRCDMRGFGLSEWEPEHFDFEHMVGDLEAVVDAAGAERFDLLGLTHGGTIAMAYAARHPERVRKLVLVNSFAAGWRVRADPEEIAWRESLMEMNRRAPSLRRTPLGEMLMTLYYPSAGQELIDWHNENFRKLGRLENMEPMIELVSRIDIRDELATIRAPTLAFHCRLDGNVPIAAGRQAAEGIAGARFVELDSANHFVLADEPAWQVITREMREFLAE